MTNPHNPQPQGSSDPANVLEKFTLRERILVGSYALTALFFVVNFTATGMHTFNVSAFSWLFVFALSLTFLALVIIRATQSRNFTILGLSLDQLILVHSLILGVFVTLWYFTGFLPLASFEGELAGFGGIFGSLFPATYVTIFAPLLMLSGLGVLFAGAVAPFINPFKSEFERREGGDAALSALARDRVAPEPKPKVQAQAQAQAEQVQPVQQLQQPQAHRAFWFAIPEPRDIVDPQSGAALYQAQPGTWILGLQEREGSIVVRDDQGRAGELRNIEGIERA